MRNLVMVVFVEPVTEGGMFPREDWPLHITLLRFDLPSTAEDGSDPVRRLVEDATPAVCRALGAQLRVGPEAWFGRHESILVNLVEPDPRLQELHETIAGQVLALHGRIASQRHTLEAYRPHITHHDGRRRHAGQLLELDRVALVDMAPEGDHSQRRILKLWQGPPPA
ncbi:2'-5' RNA ligase family protein [Glutamicibacter endophyticus]|uniref:2'-5' RNA ligase family protein n=1 Tax=Glutamicibacter endophyticus TaxID=1522174 RepID=UPI003AF04A0E